MPSDQAEPQELYRLGLEAYRRGDQGESRRLNEEALEAARNRGDRVNEARALIGLSRVAFREGNHAEVERLAAVCMPIWETLPDQTAVTSPTHMLAESHRLHGRFEDARELYLRNIEDARRADDHEMIEMETINLALLEVAVGHHQTAMDLVRRYVTDDEASDDPYLLLARGAARVSSGDDVGGVTDLAASAELLEAAGEILDPADQGVFDQAVERARIRQGEERFAALWSARAGD